MEYYWLICSSLSIGPIYMAPYGRSSTHTGPTLREEWLSARRPPRAAGGGGGPAGQRQWSAERLVLAPKVEAIRPLHVLNELVEENGTPLSGWKCAIVFDIDFLERGSDRHAACYVPTRFRVCVMRAYRHASCVMRHACPTSCMPKVCDGCAWMQIELGAVCDG